MLLTLATTPNRVNQALEQLLQRARMEDKDAQRIALCLLSLHAGPRWPLDLRELAYLPSPWRDHLRHVFNFLLATQMQLSAFIPATEIAPLIDQWGYAEATKSTDATV